jgi:hypothetical protein
MVLPGPPRGLTDQDIITTQMASSPQHLTCWLKSWSRILKWPSNFLSTVTCLLKARIAKPEEMAVARERPVNTFPRQRIHERNNRCAVVSGVFYAVQAEAV